MSKLDVLKEQINYLKLWLGIFVVTVIGLLGWFASHYKLMEASKVLLTMLSLLFLLVSIHFLNRLIIKGLRKQNN